MTDVAAETQPASAPIGTTWRLLFAEAGEDPLEDCKDAPPLAQAISEAAKGFPSACWDDVQGGVAAKWTSCWICRSSGCCSMAG